ncbi:stomatin family protein [Alternaria alternata]|nr:stomatin family protein [Alternaria alternata]
MSMHKSSTRYLLNNPTFKCHPNYSNWDGQEGQGRESSQRCASPTQNKIYYLPEILLQRLENIPSRDPWTHEIHLVDVDASIGHVLIHFLHTGVYQTLNDEDVEDAENIDRILVQNEFQIALLTLEAAEKYSVPGLQELAQIELERRGNEMCLRDVVHAIREEFIAGPADEHAWLRDFVSKKVRLAFEQDPPMLSAPDFFENIESPTLTRLLAQVVVGLYSEEVDKLRKGKTTTDKISTPEHSEPPGSYSPDLSQDPSNRTEATAPAALSSCNREETMESERRMKEDAVVKERENVEARVREEALAKIQQLGAERENIAQLQEKDFAVARSVATKDEADIFKLESTWDSWGGVPVISEKRKKVKKGHTAGLPPPPPSSPPSPPPPPMSPSPPSSPPDIQLEDKREEEERLECEGEERLEQKRLEREEQERIAAEEERARIEAEKVKAARIAAEEEPAATAAEAETSRKKEDDIWGDWSALSAGKMKKKGKKGKVGHFGFLVTHSSTLNHDRRPSLYPHPRPLQIL